MNQTTIFSYDNALGNITFSSSGKFWITEIDGVSGIEVSLSASQSAKQIGASLTSQSVQPRTILVDGCIFEPLAQNRQKLINIIAPQVASRLTVIDNGESWYLDVVPERTPEITPGNGVQDFQMRLYAQYPYWQTTEQQAIMLAGLHSMFKFPFFTGGRWWISRFSQEYVKDIYNSGNVPLEFDVLFIARAELSDPEIIHMGTGQVIRLQKTMAVGEKAVISTRYGQRGVVITHRDGTEENGLRYISLDSDMGMAMLPGHNTIRQDAGEGRSNLTARLYGPQGVKSGV